MTHTLPSAVASSSEWSYAANIATPLKTGQPDMSLVLEEGALVTPGTYTHTHIHTYTHTAGTYTHMAGTVHTQGRYMHTQGRYCTHTHTHIHMARQELYTHGRHLAHLLLF